MTSRSSWSLVLAGAAAVLGGCTTTQTKDARLTLRAERVIAGRKPLKVTRPTPDVQVDRVALVRAKRTAIVVELTNRTGRALGDLPISVGVGRRLLNHRRNLDYFDTHVASVGPHATVRWVFTARGKVRGGRPFARVGAPVRSVARLPTLRVRRAGAGIVVRNATDVTQYDLPVYALARRGRRYVAAGRATVEQLDGNASAGAPLQLTGDPGRVSVSLQPLPTIFR